MNCWGSLCREPLCCLEDDLSIFFFCFFSFDLLFESGVSFIEIKLQDTSYPPRKSLFIFFEFFFFSFLHDANHLNPKFF